ncbi:MAG: tetratricopeptide repeat protein [Prevotella sp.]|nr:tetratricopeptide repeat protein [Prevotella sp.]
MAKVNVKEQNAENISKSEDFLLKNKKTILYAVIALIVIIAGIILYNNFVKAPREAKASTELAKGQTMFANQQFAQALNGDSTGYAGFVKIASDYSSTPAGNLANLYAGLCYANLDKWEDAVKFLDKYSPANDEMVSPAAVAALGNAYAHVKQLDKAVDALKKAAKMADSQALDNTNNSLSPTFLIQAATILESQNKKDEALKIYQDIKKKYVNSAVSQEIDKYIERALGK